MKSDFLTIDCSVLGANMLDGENRLVTEECGRETSGCSGSPWGASPGRFDLDQRRFVFRDRGWRYRPLALHPRRDRSVFPFLRARSNATAETACDQDTARPLFQVLLPLIGRLRHRGSQSSTSRVRDGSSARSRRAPAHVTACANAESPARETQLTTLAMCVRLAVSTFFTLVSTPNGFLSIWAIKGSD
jgi:hypothetical protein